MSSLYTPSTPSASHVRSHLEKGGTAPLQVSRSFTCLTMTTEYGLVLTTEYDRTILTDPAMHSAVDPHVNPHTSNNASGIVQSTLLLLYQTHLKWSDRMQWYAANPPQTSPRPLSFFCANHASDFPLRCQQGLFLAGLISLHCATPGCVRQTFFYFFVLSCFFFCSSSRVLHSSGS